MGRGRAKAKQTKIARQLKYTDAGTDLSRLRAELIGEAREAPGEGPDAEHDDGLDDTSPQ